MIRIGTRSSKLAMAQAELVAQAYRVQGIEVQIIPVSNRGDKNLTLPMSELGKDLFIDGLSEKLRKGEIDVAVHSAKDLPADLPFDGFYAFDRADARDVILSVGKVGRIGTGSARRISELKKLYPHAEFCPIRGNIDTRIGKLRRGEYDAVVLAKAGLDRLKPDLDGLDCRVLSVEECMPAACQGIIVVEGEMGKLVEKEDLSRVARLEREAQYAVGADCGSGVGVYLDDGWLKGSKNGRHFQVWAAEEGAAYALARGLK